MTKLLTLLARVLSPLRRLMPPVADGHERCATPSLSMAALPADATTIDISVSALIYMYVHFVNKVRRKDRCHLLTIKMGAFEDEAAAETGMRRLARLKSGRGYPRVSDPREDRP